MAVTVVVETYTHSEIGALALVRRALAAARDVVAVHGGEVLLADAGGSVDVASLVESEFPDIRVVDATGRSYDEAKAACAAAARADVVLFLDGDCVPEPGWAEAHLATLGGGAMVSAGVTRYEGGFLARVLTLLDFGFLFPARPRPVGCYASNNVAFRRETLLSCGIPDTGMRCSCYAHAQRLLAEGTPVQLSPGAAARHALPSFLDERLRQGGDLVRAAVANPALPSAGWLRWGVLAAPLFFADALRLDWQRLASGRRDLGLGRLGALAAGVLAPVLRVPDAVGIVAALRRARVRG